MEGYPEKGVASTAGPLIRFSASLPSQWWIAHPFTTAMIVLLCKAVVGATRRVVWQVQRLDHRAALVPPISTRYSFYSLDLPFLGRTCILTLNALVCSLATCQQVSLEALLESSLVWQSL